MTDARGGGTESDKPAPPAASPTPYGPYPGPYPPPYSSYPPPPPYGAGYPPSPYGGYPVPPPPRPPAGPRNGLGVAALVLAIIGLVLTLSVIGGIVLGLLAVIIGIAALGRCKRGEADNRGVATSGIVLGIIAVLVSIAFIWVWVGVGQRWFDEFGGPEYMDCMQRAGSDPVAQQQCEDALRNRVEHGLGVTPTSTR
ncbi:DUF4190 domain-containing protein [Mycobacterium dioxanotrophicus]|uniref:DUF4190 domain-containing protein n=1 Tax=Mycobacterium dioxanotrophicus TaxID=482462 RepID=A0A1Y0C512_9MYCO|nr:DUF4190 domain-containing protein [Mycobacterium dioxanotrophicus]ART70165.1 DUF4190 domain-containing protein [Mycobacterium dioxanotrophicus]